MKVMNVSPPPFIVYAVGTLGWYVVALMIRYFYRRVTSVDDEESLKADVAPGER